ncbi:ABC transporter permease [Lactiplantibacillus daowaiensis]|uniref:ABC transporter permease n=1 Tax=Lactiplantibacillus daowaiensis TaxID=2559918 RepID=A0ABW1S322_9LACO|nr:ABC transporter permease [Lactiplantibacillus daowaiensis]
MTSFGSLFKAMSRDKFRQMNQLLALELIATVVTLIWVAIKGEFSSSTLMFATMGWAPLPSVVGVIILAFGIEKTYTADSFRLMPVEETKLYSTNLLTSLVNLVYFTIIQAVVCSIAVSIAFFSDGGASMMGNMPPARAMTDFVGMLIAVVVLYLILNLLIWSTISFVHLITRAASSFLPKMRQQVVNIVIYVVVIFLTLRLSGFIIHGVAWVSRVAFSNNDWSQIWVSIVAMAVVILIEGAINVICLKKWVETDAN